MNVVIEIDGREAIPVRALPWVTSEKFGAKEMAEQTGRKFGAGEVARRSIWHFGAQQVAEAFAGDLDWPIPVQARYLEDSEVRNYPGGYWKNTHTVAVEELVEMKLTRDEWEFAATKALPAGVFVWRDEWEAAYNASPDGPEALSYLAEYSEDTLWHWGSKFCATENKKDAKARALNFKPRILDKKICDLVMEGFIKARKKRSLKLEVGEVNMRQQEQP